MDQYCGRLQGFAYGRDVFAVIYDCLYMIIIDHIRKEHVINIEMVTVLRIFGLS